MIIRKHNQLFISDCLRKDSSAFKDAEDVFACAGAFSMILAIVNGEDQKGEMP